jgi:uncharacterized protein YecT (DUF1311 family)
VITTRLIFLFLICSSALAAGDVSTAFNTLLSGARSVRIITAPQDGEAKGTVTDYSTASEVARVASAFDFVDPKPGRRPDGSAVYVGPCMCLPTHFVTFVLKDGSELPLFLVVEADEPALADVEKADAPRLNMPWHTSLRLTPKSEEAVRALLKVSPKKRTADNSGAAPHQVIPAASRDASVIIPLLKQLPPSPSILKIESILGGNDEDVGSGVFILKFRLRGGSTILVGSQDGKVAAWIIHASANGEKETIFEQKAAPKLTPLNSPSAAPGGYASTDQELVRLRSALSTAQSQMEMNLRSGELAQYLDQKVTALEERIKKDLDREALASFTSAARKWRDYRTAQTKAEGDVYRGGSMQPLIHNQVFSRITEERLAALQNWGPEGSYQEK